jgi:hypothetical protein
MHVPRILLAAIAVTIAVPAVSAAQAARPGLSTTTVSPLSERRNHDDDVCGLRTLRGTYVFAASGFNIVAGVAIQKAIVEVVEFNGDGTLSVPTVTLSVNGVVSRPPPSTGTYTLDNHCSGTILFAGPAFDIFVARDAETIWLIQTGGPTPAVFQGTATRTSRSRERR